MKKNIWHAVKDHPELLVGQYVVPNFVSNSMAIKISETEFVIMSPGEALLSAWVDTFGVDIKLHIVFPNSYHHIGVNAWIKAFKDTSLYASKVAIPQLADKGFSDTNIQALEEVQPPLPQGYDILFPPGHKAGDIWIRKQHPVNAKNAKTSTWITCDSFLNYDRLSNQPIAKIMQKALGAAPGLKISQVVKWFIMNDRKSFKTWVLAQLDQDQPTTLIPSHGEISHDPLLPAQIRKVINQRL